MDLNDKLLFSLYFLFCFLFKLLPFFVCITLQILVYWTRIKEKTLSTIISFNGADVVIFQFSILFFSFGSVDLYLFFWFVFCLFFSLCLVFETSFVLLFKGIRWEFLVSTLLRFDFHDFIQLNVSFSFGWIGMILLLLPMIEMKQKIALHSWSLFVRLSNLKIQYVIPTIIVSLY